MEGYVWEIGKKRDSANAKIPTDLLQMLQGSGELDTSQQVFELRRSAPLQFELHLNVVLSKAHMPTIAVNMLNTYFER